MTANSIMGTDNRILLPADWVEELGLRGPVLLEKTPEGVLVRPAPRLTWDEVFANKLPIGQTAPEGEDWQVTRDDLLF